ADREFVTYYTGFAKRGQGVTSLATAQAKPQEAAQHKATAKQRFEEAAKAFGDAAAAFAEKGKEAKAEKGLPTELEGMVRSRCDQAEMLLRVGKAKDAREAIASVLDKKYAESKFATQSHYFHGFACFLVGEHTEAGRSLAREKVLGDEVFGTHARYLL